MMMMRGEGVGMLADCTATSKAMAMSSMIAVAIIAGLPAGGCSKVKGSGNTAYVQVADYWAYEDGKTNFELPTVQELAAENMIVQEDATEFTVAFHVKNMATGAFLWRLVPAGFDWSDQALADIPMCGFLSQAVGTGLAFFGNDCGDYLLGDACKWESDQKTIRLNEGKFPVPLADDLNVRNGVHIAMVQKAGYFDLYVDGKHRITVESIPEITPHMCFGGHFQFEFATGFIRDLRVYPRALDASELLQSLATNYCNGIPSYPGLMDDPSFGYVGSDKASETCMDYYSQLANGLIAECPPEAQKSCPVSCTEEVLCSPPPIVESIELGLRGPLELCLNTDQLAIDEVIERCKTLAPFNDSWSEGNWPSVDGGGRRLGHLPDAVCPGGTPELDKRDMRLVHDPECDFSGSSFDEALRGPAYSFWWWSKRSSSPGKLGFLHSIASEARSGSLTRSSQTYADFLDDTVWLNAGWEGAAIWKDIFVDYVEPVYSEDNQAGRWVFKAFIVNGSNISTASSTFMIDDSHATKIFRPEVHPVTGLEALWFSQAGDTDPTNYSALRFTPTAMTVQQLQQIYHAESSLYLLCPPGQFHDSSKGGQCSKCAVNTFTSTEGLAACETCSPGSEANTTESTSCTPCWPGSFSLAGSACQLCAKGTAGNESRASSCPVCMPGRFADEFGSLTCKDCQPGLYAPGIQEHRCSTCTSGRFSESQASTECAACDFGSYQTDPGASGCYKCHVTYTTPGVASEDAAACTCAPGSYLNVEANTCNSCEGQIGYSCPGGLGLPLVQSDFYAEPVGNTAGSKGVAGSFSRMKVWHCSVPGNCQGERDMGVCPPNMKGYGCALCEDGYARSGDLLSCESCSEEGGTAIFTVCFLSLFPIGYVVCTLNHSKYMPTISIKVIVMGMVSIVATFLQFQAVMLPFQINWPGWFRRFGEDVAGIVMLDPGFSKPACAIGTSLAMDIFGKLLAPIVLSLVIVFDVLLINLVLNKISKKLFPYIEFADALYTVGKVLTALYVMTCKATFSFIECGEQPSAPSTLLSYPAIECGSDDHMAALPVFILGVVIYVIGIWSVILWLNVKAVTLHNNSENRRQWRKILAFMVGKWKPSVWYWGQVYLTRNLFVSLVAVFQPNDGYFQAFLFCTFVGIPILMTALKGPWRHEINNQLDVLVSPFLLLVAILGTARVTLAPAVQDAQDRAGIAIGACLFIAGAVLAFYIVLLVLQVLQGLNPVSFEKKRIESLTTALAFMGKKIDGMDFEVLKAFLSSIEPPERQQSEDFCMLMDDLLLHNAIHKFISTDNASDQKAAYFPKAPRRLMRSNSVTLHDLKAANKVTSSEIADMKRTSRSSKSLNKDQQEPKGADEQNAVVSKDITEEDGQVTI